jgi:photosystem II stability/assembly factor-like uncharacterized protein
MNNLYIIQYFRYTTKFFLTGIFLTLFFASNIYSQQNEWVRQANSPTIRWLKKCLFTDSQHGWAAGDSGVIIHTSDSGNTWTLQNSYTTDPIDDIFFLNNNTGWCVSNSYYHAGTAIFKTTNGGINWTNHEYPDTTQALFTIYFRNENTGFMGGYYGTILKTTDGGTNWVKSTLDTGVYSHFMVRDIKFFSDRYGIASGGIMDSRGVMWRTTDYGLSWISQGVAPEPLYDLDFIDSQKILVSGGDFEFGAATVRSDNGGITWDYDSLLMFGIGYSFGFRTRAEVWMALGFSTRWALSKDTGSTWQMIAGPDSAGIWGVYFIDSLHGWAVGSYGAIYKFNPLAIGIKPAGSTIPVAFHLNQNYPNPFNPRTTINFQVPRFSNVKLAVYDVLGREVAVLINEQLRPGSYEVNWDAGEFASGIYFCRMEAGTFTGLIKMVLLK